MVRLKRFTTLMLLVLLAAACDDPTVSTSIESTTAEVATSPTSTPVTTTSVQTTTSSVPRADGSVGTHEALIQLMEPTLDAVKALYGIQAADVPIPDTHGGPEAGIRQLLLQEFWVYSHAPLESWAAVLARENSPDWELLRSFYNTVGFRVATFDASSQDPYVILEARLASESERLAVPAAILEGAGEGGVVVYFRSSLQPHELVDSEEPTLTQPREGWTDRASLGVIVPTEVGWQFFWSES